jgi:hypothetical protein
MTPRILIVLTVVILTSCKDNPKKKSLFKSVAPTDTICLLELKKAKIDFERGKLVYCHYTGNMTFKALRSEVQMTELLTNFRIEYKNESSSCVTYNGQTEHCYCNFMDEKIKEKFGGHFLDSLLDVSDRTNYE